VDSLVISPTGVSLYHPPNHPRSPTNTRLQKTLTRARLLTLLKSLTQNLRIFPISAEARGNPASGVSPTFGGSPFPNNVGFAGPFYLKS